MGESKTCLVTGATGAVGPALVSLLVKNGYHVRILIRPGSNTQFLPVGISHVVGDINDKEILQSAVNGVDIVFHLAAKVHINDPKPWMEAEFNRINVLGTKNIVEAAALNNVNRFIFFSTINVYEPTPDGGVRSELSEVKPDTIYAESKVKAERIVLSTKRKIDQEPFSTILRSASVFGPNMKGNYARVIKGISSGWFFPIGKCQNRRTLVTDYDLARAAIMAAESQKAISEIYNVTDGQVYTLKEIYDSIWRGLGKRPPKFYVPIFPFKIGVFCLQLLFGLIGKETPISVNTVGKMLEDRSVDGSKIQEELNYTPSISMDEGWEIAISGILNS